MPPSRKAKTFSPRERAAAAIKQANQDLTPDTLDAARALEEHGEDVNAVMDACHTVGMPRDMVAALINRLAVTKAGHRRVPKKITTRELVGRIEERLDLVTHYLDELGMAQASPKDLAIIFGILVEKRQLLLGEPTQILSTTERTHINDLIPELVKEAKRRGMIIDLNPGSYKEIGAEYKSVKVVAPPPRPKPVAHNRKLLQRKPD